MGALRGKEKWRPDRTGAPRGSHAWRDPQGLGSGGSMPRISPAQSARDVCPALGLGPTPSEASSRPRWSWGIGGRPGENKRGRWRGPPGQEEQEWRAFSPTRWACWAPRWGPLPSETRGGRHAWGPSVPLSLNPTPPHAPQGLFQPCGS